MKQLDTLIKLALAEDIGEEDVTTNAIVDPNLQATAIILAKQNLVVAGLNIARKVFEMVSKNICWNPEVEDGEQCDEMTILARVHGLAAALLQAERTALNFLQHLSGIATTTNLFAISVANTKVKILDTRKTTPGLRALEKHAVLMGDGVNHRLGLYDRYLVKDNHIKIAGSITKAVEMIANKRKPGLLLEIETENLDDVKEALACGADIIMLDNMSYEDVRQAVKLVKGKAKLEVSGNVNLDTITHYAATGVDYISVGAITHSAPAADISMEIET
ncbi:MAG: carboxylating nicotinate-nucleotide diphosphorylase [Pseudomonadota bacterium]